MACVTRVQSMRMHADKTSDVDAGNAMLRQMANDGERSAARLPYMPSCTLTVWK